MARTLHPVFLDLGGRRVLLVGGGRIALEKARALAEAGASIVVVAPEVHPEMVHLATTIFRRAFQASDVDEAWYVVAAAPPDVNAEARRAADERHVFVNAVDDRDRATAFAASVIRRGPVTMAIGTGGDAPALARLLREGLERLVPEDVSHWASLATDLREQWLRDGTPMPERRPELLAALAALHCEEAPNASHHDVPPAPLAQVRLKADPTYVGAGLSRPAVGPKVDPTYVGAGFSRPAVGPKVDPTYVGAGFSRPAVGPKAEPGCDCATRSEGRTNRERELREQRRGSTPGLVSIVGAGPGHPDLLTRRGAQCLAEADLVLYDALISPEMLALAPHAQCVLVGRRKGRATLSQEGIHRVMIAAARRGRRVVRLKGGDPFVFGRGGEEALALTRASVPFEIVPGVSTAFAAPALASIPVTHRDVSSGVLVVSGHDEQRFARQVASVPPDEVTVVILMGHSVRARLAERLLDAGWSATTPVAIVSAASHADEDVESTTIGELACAMPEVRLKPDPTYGTSDHPPATLVIGDVVRLRQQIAGERVSPDAGAGLAGASRREVSHG